MRKVLALCALATASLALVGIAGATANDTDTLVTNGGTDLSAGLEKGYELAEKYRGTGRINRVAILSDGIARQFPSQIPVQ